MSDSFELARFDGKVAVVTGAAQGIGEATARLLAARGAAGLVLTDRNADKGKAVAASISAQRRARPSSSPPSSTTSRRCRPSFPLADKRFGRVDVLVNCAGAHRSRHASGTRRPSSGTGLFAINVRAPFFLMQAALKVMDREKIEGAIVNIISVNAHGGSNRLTPYSASKGALATLTKNVAARGRRRGASRSTASISAGSTRPASTRR